MKTDVSQSAAPPPLLAVDGLTKSFGTLKANDAVDFDIVEGEIHALLGENGAGKSTLVKMLFGSLSPDAGRILWRGRPVKIAEPSTARKLGIGMVFQHFSLFDSLTVAENIALSLEAGTPLSTVADEARRLGEAYGLTLNPHAMAGDLSVGERQRVEIIRCLLQEPSLIILDEPTSVLTPQEAERLFETLETLKGEGKAILYISHRLEEVKRMCDRATVLRHGQVVAHCDPRAETAASLAAMMVGAEVEAVRRSPADHEAAGRSRTAVLCVSALDQKPLGPFSTALRGIQLEVHAGEVFGIAGVAGNGQSELFEALSGEQLQHDPDAVIIDGTPAGRLGPNGRRRLGAAFAPEERFGHAAVAAMPLTDNILLSRHASDASAYLSGGRFAVLRHSALGRTLGRVVKAMDVRKSGENPDAATLSGGNLQKLILGREFDRQPVVFVVNQPTWGVDAGAAARIRQTLLDAANAGAGALVISQDLDELLEICDRIAVIADGEMSEPLDARTVTREQLGLLMGGAEPEKHHGVAA
ncbi:MULTISPECIES: ABC transporter ATP-binding protein [unclassified Roseitalea]|uniref:ABC transporter ATP-binding protein n=1 Tax=unclassified Roseitalea TaxID=2639107 RepID=UPI00273D2885|nr:MULTISPECIES: ABC transporter ATP-binding protein [unclassified Roseitalea]